MAWTAWPPVSMATGPIALYVSNDFLERSEWSNWWEGRYSRQLKAVQEVFRKGGAEYISQPALVTPVSSYATREQGMRYCVSSVDFQGIFNRKITGLMQYAMVSTGAVTKTYSPARRQSKSNIYISLHQTGILASKRNTYLVMGMNFTRTHKLL